jgi:hypothetical protein
MILSSRDRALNALISPVPGKVKYIIFLTMAQTLHFGRTPSDAACSAQHCGTISDLLITGSFRLHWRQRNSGAT